MTETCFDSPRWFASPKDKKGCLPWMKSAASRSEDREKSPQTSANATTAFEEVLDQYRSAFGSDKRLRELLEAWHTRTARPSFEARRRVFSLVLRERSSRMLAELAKVAEHVEETLLEKRFREQADKWAQETQHLSSPTQRMAHPSYQAILGMAQENKRAVIQLLLLDLQQRRRAWFWALSYLTQANPIGPRDAGKMDKMIKAWVEWGKAEGII